MKMHTFPRQKPGHLVHLKVVEANKTAHYHFFCTDITYLRYSGSSPDLNLRIGLFCGTEIECDDQDEIATFREHFKEHCDLIGHKILSNN